MWLMTRTGIFSITNAPGKSAHWVQIRSRWRKDLSNLRDMHPALRSHKIITTPEADYRYRMVVTRTELHSVIRTEVEEVTYTNFKAAVAVAGDEARNNLLHRIWGVIADAASREEHKEWAKREGVI